MDNMTIYREAIEIIHSKLIKNGAKFDSVSPYIYANGGTYKISGGTNWTDSFYVGMLWLDWCRTKNAAIYHNIEMQMQEFEQRLKQNRGLDNHDIGFLYTLSAVAGYKATGDGKYAAMAEKAARLLAKRYHPGAKFIQAWGNPNGRDNYRLIIDCMLNIPLIYWCAEKTGDRALFEIAYNHAVTTNKVIFRNDSSAYHTYYFDYDTGKPLCGKTHQGAGDDTAWSRGQAWAIYGFAISYTLRKTKPFCNRLKRRRIISLRICRKIWLHFGICALTTGIMNRAIRRLRRLRHADCSSLPKLREMHTIGKRRKGLSLHCAKTICRPMKAKP